MTVAEYRKAPENPESVNSEPVKESLQMQRNRSAPVPADPTLPAPPDAHPVASVQIINLCLSAEGYPVLNQPLYGSPGPTMRRMHPTDATGNASAGRQVSAAPPLSREEKAEGAPRPIGYIPIGLVKGKVRGAALWRKAWPEFVALFLIGVVFNPLVTYVALFSIIGGPLYGLYAFYSLIGITLYTLGVPLLLWGGALIYALYRITRKYRALERNATPVGPFWFCLVYDRLPEDIAPGYVAPGDNVIH